MFNQIHNVDSHCGGPVMGVMLFSFSPIIADTEFTRPF
jgi:hypothetical protein